MQISADLPELLLGKTGERKRSQAWSALTCLHQTSSASRKVSRVVVKVGFERSALHCCSL